MCIQSAPPCDRSAEDLAIEVPEPPVRLVSPLCRQFHDYWWSLHRPDAARSVPLRSAVDPACIKPVLPYILLHELAQPGKSMLRLVGTAITERLDFDPTGHDYLDYVSDARKSEAYDTLSRTAHHPCGMRVVMETRYRGGKRTVAESLGYPLVGRRLGRRVVMMMFVDDLIEPVAHELLVHERRLEYFNARERDYIDIGYGVPPRAE